VSPAVFKTDTTAVKVVGWVRFPDAPAILRSPRGWVLVVLLAAASLSLTVPASVLRAQEPEPPPAGQDTLPAAETGQDTLPPAGADQDTLPAAGADQAAPDRERPVSPAGAMLRSVIVPGWGQTAARQPARGAIYFTVWSGGIFMIVKTNADLNAAKRAEDEELIDSRSQAREDWILFTGLWALLSGVDAWVSAQFAGFEGEVRPPQDGSPGVEFAYPVKLF
jgi:hypothetical protein